MCANASDLKQRFAKEPLTASFTVEAALILPIITFVIFALIQSVFLLQERTQLQAELTRASAFAVQLAHGPTVEQDRTYNLAAVPKQSLYQQYVTKPSDVEAQTKDYIRENTQFLRFLTIESISVDVTWNDVVIEATAKATIPFVNSIPFLPKKMFSSSYRMVQPLYTGEEKARLIATVTQTVERIKGVSEGIQKLRDLIERIR